MFSAEQIEKARDVMALCRQQGLRITTAESCTGGLIAALFTEIAGSSEVFERGFVTYSNEAKAELLSVPMDLIEEWGAISSQVAAAMSKGALRNSRADISVSVTGIAGPGGGSKAKPVGLVYLSAATQEDRVLGRKCQFGDIGRSMVRKATMLAALQLLNEVLPEVQSERP
ncbi:MAG: CinA family protein [Hyphomicrobiaceae bacterium]|nr:CinA family protein [Hyphomicrobiaceae bacterium]